MIFPQPQSGIGVVPYHALRPPSAHANHLLYLAKYFECSKAQLTPVVHATLEKSGTVCAMTSV
jgi:hypothetical protein